MPIRNPTGGTDKQWDNVCQILSHGVQIIHSRGDQKTKWQALRHAMSCYLGRLCHSLDPASLTSARFAHGNSVMTPDRWKRLELYMELWQPLVSIPPSCIHVGCVDAHFFSSAPTLISTSTTEFWRIKYSENVQSCSMVYTNRGSWYQHVVAELETDTVEPNKSLQALMHPPQTIDHLLTFFEYKPVSS